MKKIILTLLLSISIVSLALASKEYKREITKEFAVSASPTLQIDNKYGNIRIIESTENKITFKIEIIGKGKNEELAKKYAETVKINFSQSSNKVSAETELTSISCNNCGRSIHYTVVAPKSVIMNLQNKYGNIYLDNVKQPLKVELKYGDLHAGTLEKTDLDIKYGKATIQSCTNLNLDSKYSSFSFDQIGTLNADSKYDNFTIGTISDFKLETGYTDVKIDKLTQRFVANNFKYGKLTISDVSTSFSEIKIDAGYSTLNIGLTPSHNFKTALYTKYGKIKTGNITFNNVSLKKEDTIVGTAGNNSNPTATVNISASYGDIVFK